MLVCGLLAFAGSVVGAEDSSNPEPTLIKAEGEPFQVTYDADRIVRFKVYQELRMLETTFTLSENNCSSKLGMKVKYRVPVIQRAFLPFWWKHPQKQGEPVLSLDSDSQKFQPDKALTFASPLNEEEFQRLTALEAAKPDLGRPSKFSGRENLGRIATLICEGDCAKILPPITELRYWDENFETGNRELLMAPRKIGSPPKVNAMTSRLEQLPVQFYGNQVLIGRPLHAAGFVEFYPPGVGYEIRWNIKLKNLVDEDDDLCQMKWSEDFTPIFTQFTSFSEKFKTPESIRTLELRDYSYSSSDERNFNVYNIMGKWHWYTTEIQK